MATNHIMLLDIDDEDGWTGIERIRRILQETARILGIGFSREDA